MTFPIPRPKAAEAPAKLPRRTNHSKAPKQGTLRNLPNNIQTPEQLRQAAIEREVAHALKDSQIGRYYRPRTSSERGRNDEKWSIAK